MLSAASRIAPFALALAMGASLLTGCASSSSPSASAPPPATAGPRVMASAANPLATQAAIRVLKEGGSAVDAAVAVQAVLGLVEPQSSGLGGGAFMTFYDAKARKVVAYNGRETAPAGATPDMFLGPEGRPMPFPQAVTSGRSTGAPGAIAMLAMAQKDYGKLPWKSLFTDAEKLADDGFVVSPRLAGMIASNGAQARGADARAYFTKADGKQYKAGDTLKNPAYADTLRRIAAEGPKGLLAGPVGEAIVAKVHEGLAGSLTLADMAAYKPLKSDGLCVPWRVYIVCTPPPPSGGASLLEALKLLEKTDIASRGPKDPVAWVQMAEAERLMYADRDKYMADPDVVPVPTAGLLSDGYIAERAKLIGQTAGAPPQPGNPPGAPKRGMDGSLEPGGTTHMVIIDADGNALSMTTTVESVFGSGRFVRGFFLNNQLTDFSLAPKDAQGLPVANAVAPGKRPRSAMSPVIVLDKDRRFVAALGSPGGPAIISYNLKAMVGVFDWGLSMQEAVSLPNLVARGNSFSGETNLFGPELSAALQARGVTVREGQNENSGLHGIIRRPTGLEGGADPRREGVVLSF
ncbi:MAG: gamma-glutamyltransferase [Caulobacterales bacterium 68-7]|nr:MAG: gamma-glutamyltransferase [Caulobacterales bacterium 68-7]